MKVCHLSTVHQRRDVRIVYKECSSLARAGYATHLVIADGKGDEVFQGVRIHGTPKHQNRFKRMLLGPLQILARAISLRADVYHFHDVELLPISLILRLLGSKVIYDVHDDVPKQIMGKHYIARPLRWAMAAAVRFLESLLSRAMSAIVTADPAKQKRFGEYNKLVRAVHNYPLLDELHMIDAQKRDPASICYIGGITRIRGIIQLLDAILPLDVRFLLAGSFDPPSLEAECRSHPAWDKVDYLGFLNRREVAEVLSKSSVGMVIWLPNENYLDSLPIKMFEYMSASMPVIASAFPNLQGVVERYDCGICVEPENIGAITKAISTLLENPDLARQMGHRGHEAVISQLNWDSQAEILYDLYQKVLAK